MKATEKQVRYTMMLLTKAGYSTRYMDASFKQLGATMRQRSGSVSGWLESLTVYEISALIDKLKKAA